MGPSQTLRSAVKHAAYRSFSAAGSTFSCLARAQRSLQQGCAKRQIWLGTAAELGFDGRLSASRSRSPRPARRSIDRLRGPLHDRARRRSSAGCSFLSRGASARHRRLSQSSRSCRLTALVAWSKQALAELPRRRRGRPPMRRSEGTSTNDVSGTSSRCLAAALNDLLDAPETRSGRAQDGSLEGARSGPSMVLVASARRLPVVTLDDHFERASRTLYGKVPDDPYRIASIYPSAGGRQPPPRRSEGSLPRLADSPRDDPPRRPGGPSRDASAGLPHGLCRGLAGPLDKLRRHPPRRPHRPCISPPPSSEAHRPPSRHDTDTLRPKPSQHPRPPPSPRGRYDLSDTRRHDPLRRPRPLDTSPSARHPPARALAHASTPSATTLPRGRSAFDHRGTPRAAAAKGPLDTLRGGRTDTSATLRQHAPQGDAGSHSADSAATFEAVSEALRPAPPPPRFWSSPRGPSTSSSPPARRSPRRLALPVDRGPTDPHRAPRQPLGGGLHGVSDGPPLHRAIAPRRARQMPPPGTSADVLGRCCCPVG